MQHCSGSIYLPFLQTIRFLNASAELLLIRANPSLGRFKLCASITLTLCHFFLLLRIHPSPKPRCMEGISKQTCKRAAFVWHFLSYVFCPNETNFTVPFRDSFHDSKGFPFNSSKLILDKFLLLLVPQNTWSE